MTTTNKDKRIMGPVKGKNNNVSNRDELQQAISGLCESADRSIVSLFNTMVGALGDPFRYPETGSIDRLRQIVSSWSPLEHEIDLLSDSEFRTRYVKSQFFKRYISVDESAKVERDMQARSARKFLDTNAEGWSYDAYVMEHEELKPLMDRMRYIVGQALGDFSLEEIYRNCKHGPNSTTTIARDNAYLDVKNGDWDGTAASLQQFHHYLCWDNTLHDYLVDSCDKRRSLLNDLSEWEAYIAANAKDYTKLSLVAKDWKSLRTMCPERTIPAFFGQGVGITLQARLLNVNIDLATQPDVHQRLALLASLLPELNLGTLDWSEASDRIWLSLCSAVMTEGSAPQWLDFMINVCRCSSTEVQFSACVGENHDYATMADLELYLRSVSDSFNVKRIAKVKGDNAHVVVKCVVRVKTSMLSTMGNAITFPLQTLLFYAFLSACSDLAQDRANANVTSSDELQQFAFPSSFGDDGIIDSRAYHVVKHFAPLIGWRLNASKTFMRGKFRESCGGDYYHGKATRPLMMKRPPIDTTRSFNWNKKLIQAWLYIAANQAVITLAQLSLPASIIDKWLIAEHQRFGLGKICMVPPSYPDGSGLRCDNLDASHYIDGVGWVHDVNSGVHPSDPSWHVPYYTISAGFVFKCLSVVPRLRPVGNGEYHYLWNALRKTSQTDSNSYFTSRSILDAALTARETLQLDSDNPSYNDSGSIAGCVPIKECRLLKVTSSTLSWC